MPTFGEKTSHGRFTIQVDAKASKILNFDPLFFNKVLKRFGELALEQRRKLIMDQFVEYPSRSTTKVVNRSGTFKKSIKLTSKIVNNQVILIAKYDPRYQTIQPFDNAASVTIHAGEKNFLAIPNAIPDLIDTRGSYKFKDIDLHNPRHPFGIESKRLKRRGTVLMRVRGNQRGMIFYFLKKSITIKTKRPIYVADQRLLRMNPTILKKAFDQVFKETFLS